MTAAPIHPPFNEVTETTTMTTAAQLLASTALIACIIRHADEKPMDALPPININGQHFKLAFNAELALPQAAIDVARDAGVPIELLPESPALIAEGNGDAVAAVGVGGQPDGSGSSDDVLDLGEHPTEEDLANLAERNAAFAAEQAAGETLDSSLLGFDADAVIAGPIKDVLPRLADLTAAQRAVVRAAEVDREVSRKGVTDAIDAIEKAAETPAA